MKKQLYIKNKNILNRLLIKKVHILNLVSIIVHTAACFHSLGIDSKQEVSLLFQEIFNIFKCVGTLHVFHIKCSYFPFTRISPESVNMQNINVDFLNYNIHIYRLQ